MGFDTIEINLVNHRMIKTIITRSKEKALQAISKEMSKHKTTLIVIEKKKRNGRIKISVV